MHRIKIIYEVHEPASTKLLMTKLQTSAFKVNLKKIKCGFQITSLKHLIMLFRPEEVISTESENSTGTCEKLKGSVSS